MVCCLKAYSLEDGGPLRWELRRLKDAAGYDERSRNSAVGVLFKDQSPKWKIWMRQLDFVDSQHCGKSATSAARGSADADDLASADANYWISTVGMLALLAYWSGSRREVAQRERAEKLGSMLLDRTAAEANNFDMRMVGEDVFELCHKGAAEGSMCDCFWRFKGRNANVGWPQHVRLWDDLVGLFRARECEAIAKHLGAKLWELAGVIDGGFASWGDLHWHAAAAAELRACPKRRRIDPHLRMWITQASVSAARFSTPGQAGKALGVPPSTCGDWRESDLASLRSAMHLALHDVQAVSLIFDGIRLGNPSKEYVVSCISELRSNISSVLPPQDA